MTGAFGQHCWLNPKWPLVPALAGAGLRLLGGIATP